MVSGSIERQRCIQPLLWSGPANAARKLGITVQRLAFLHKCEATSFYRKFERGLFTSVVEPQLSRPATLVPELPCTVVLAEDKSLYESSWHDLFQQQFPDPTADVDGACAYAYWDLASTTTMDGAINTLARDLKSPSTPESPVLPPLHNVVFVARGPVVSWILQFHLESLPLLGLVLIDPLDFDGKERVAQQYENYCTETRPDLQYTNSYRIFQDYVQHYDHWTLRLEPGVVPMCVISTKARTSNPDFWQAAAARTSRRHTMVNGPFGPVAMYIPTPADSVLTHGNFCPDVFSGSHFSQVDWSNAGHDETDPPTAEPEANVVDVIRKWIVEHVL
jgi:hypothetical protein